MSLSAEILARPSCAACYRQETKELKHRRCASCQQAAYCSKECQKEDWPMHKKTCQLQRVNRESLPARGTQVRDTMSDLKKWFSKHTQLLVYAATNAMKLHDRANMRMIQTHMFVIILEPAPSGIHGDFVYELATLRHIEDPIDGLPEDARAVLAEIPSEGDQHRLIMVVRSGTAAYLAPITVNLGSSLQHVRHLGPPDDNWQGFLERAINGTTEAKDRIKILLLHTMQRFC
ncbi:hypothetical protein MSAN_01936600 [Mycena sanguinolenta]|uniref:MYND-type domain-containing protein n=1 Tax=Mycena sanguinolenta TaxID=230812 RepID=A0A8H7CQI2_9AGAR|nr:hypothetical protein MSAN_01936600 [Mycena sanguinolenta]